MKDLARKRAESIGELKPFYYVYGDEELLVEQALDRLRGLFDSEAGADFNIEVLSAPEAGVERIIDSAEALPLVADRRLVIVRDVTALSRKDQSALAEYLDHQSPGTILVLVAAVPAAGGARDASAIKKAEASPVFKKASGSGSALKFTLGRSRRQKLEDWINEEFEKKGKRVEGPARDLLVEKAGSRLRDLSSAIERVSLFAADRGTISSTDVAQVVAPGAEQGIFELVDAVAERRRDTSLYLLNRLMGQGENAHRILNLLMRQFRLIAGCKSLADRDYGSIARELGIPPFLVGKCLQQSKRFSQERLRRAFSEFRRAHIELHSTKYLPETEYQGHVLETMITRIVG